MNSFETRVRLWDKEEGIMLPTFPLFKSNFFNANLVKYKLLFYTNLKDKKGVAVYQDDIVNAYFGSNHYQYCTVEWNPDHLGMGFWLKTIGPQMCYPYGKHGYDSLNRQYEIQEALEVIGNIYENPELLEIKNEMDK